MRDIHRGTPTESATRPWSIFPPHIPFPNKHSIVLAIDQRSAADLATAIHTAMLDEMTTPMENGLARVIKNPFEFIENRPAVLLHLANEVSELRQTPAQMSSKKLASMVNGNLHAAMPTTVATSPTSRKVSAPR